MHATAPPANELSLTYRPLRQPQECGALAELMAQGFANPRASATLWLEACGWSEVRVLARNDEVAAALVRLPLAHYFGGTWGSQALPTLGLTGVTVRIDQRRHGLGRDLMVQALQEANAQGYCASALYASNFGFYRNLGYEAAAMRTKAEINLGHLAHREKSGSLQILAHDDLEAVSTLYRVTASRMPAFAERTTYLWRRLVQERNGLAPTVVLSRNAAGEPDGYVILRHGRTGDDFGQSLTIEDWAALDPRAISRLWSCVASMAPLARSVTCWTAAHDPFFLASGDPAPRLGPAQPWLLRILKVHEAICGRGYPPWLDLDLTFAVDDPLFADNRGPWRLQVREGRAQLEPAAQARIVVDIGAFSGLFSGFLPAETILALGRAQGDPTQLHRLAGLFAGPSPWLRDLY